MTILDGKLKMFPSTTIVFAPVLYDSVTGISFSNGGKFYGNLGDEVYMGLIAHTANGDHDISSPLFGLAEYTVSDPSVAEITIEGSVKFLKEGTVSIKASAYRKTASATIIVKSSSPEEDTTNDIEVTSETGTQTIMGIRSSSGGCNAGLVGLILLSAISFFSFRKKSR